MFFHFEISKRFVIWCLNCETPLIPATAGSSREHVSEREADLQTAIRQRCARENEIDNLDEQSISDPSDQGDETELPHETPPQGGGGLTVVARAGLTPARQGRQHAAARHDSVAGHTQNIVMSWTNFIVTEMTQPQIQKQRIYLIWCPLAYRNAFFRKRNGETTETISVLVWTRTKGLWPLRIRGR
jgi:hypothetical protein